MSNDDEDDITRNYHKGNARSRDAHRATNKRRDEQRILELFRQRRPAGLTSDEAEIALGIPHQTCSARFSEMKTKKWLYTVDGDTRMTRCKRPADVHYEFVTEPFWRPLGRRR